jgi:hypothetical protein
VSSEGTLVERKYPAAADAIALVRAKGTTGPRAIVPVRKRDTTAPRLVTLVGKRGPTGPARNTDVRRKYATVSAAITLVERMDATMSSHERPRYRQGASCNALKGLDAFGSGANDELRPGPLLLHGPRRQPHEPRQKLRGTQNPEVDGPRPVSDALEMKRIAGGIRSHGPGREIRTVDQEYQGPHAECDGREKKRKARGRFCERRQPLCYGARPRR